MVASARFELTNATVKVWCLTAWLRGNNEWWRDMDLNHGTRRNRFTVCRVWPLRYPSKKKMVPKTGIEPVTYWLQVSCSTNWAISAKYKWWAIQDSNLWPPACKADALTNWANPPKNKFNGARGRTWTGTRVESRRILSPVRLPIPPLGHLLFNKHK